MIDLGRQWFEVSLDDTANTCFRFAQFFKNISISLRYDALLDWGVI
jgi:hypothetical protein